MRERRARHARASRGRGRRVEVPHSDTRLTGPASPFDGLLAGAATGVGSLPHRDARAAAEFSLRENELVMIPSLPRRSPAESLIAQAVVGTPGVTLGQYGAIAVDLDRLDPEAPVVTDLAADGFGGFRAFLDRAADSGIAGTTVKWSFVGPVTLGVALIRAGAPSEIAFDVAVRSVRSHVAALGRAVGEALPGSPQLVVLDEPAMADLMSPDFALPPDAAVDLLSTAMAVAEPLGAVGVHCCAPADWASLLAAGPRVLSMPATPRAGLDRRLPATFPRGRWLDRVGCGRGRRSDRRHGRAGVASAQQSVVRVRAVRGRSGAHPAPEHDHAPLRARRPQRQRRRAGVPDGARHRPPGPRPVDRGEVRSRRVVVNSYTRGP